MRRSSSHDARYVEVRLADLNLRRQGRAILRRVNWTIRPGQRWVLAGGNGAGKTQLLKTVAGSVWPQESIAEGATRRSRRYLWRKEMYLSPFEVMQEIGYVGPERQDKYERYGWNHQVQEIVGTGLHRTDIPLNRLTAADRRHMGSLLARVGLAQLARRPFLSLSYGERRLVLLARVLASRPRLLLLDELLSGLDETNRARALRWLQGTRRSRLPWVLATHRVEDVPSAATHALVLQRGRVVYAGPIRRAPLRKWLEREVRNRASAGRTRRLPARRWLVRMIRASVYVEERKVLEDLSFEIRSHECWVVHGRNGAGKTTLLRTLYGDHAVASGGRIERAGIEPGVPLEVFKRHVGFVAPHLQSDHPQDLKAAAVVQSGRHASIGLNEPPTAADREAARRSLRFFGLSELASRPVRELSYGQLRRVLFARASVCRPRLLLLDEPLSGVDAPTRTILMSHIESMVANGTAVVISTHHRSEWPSCVTHEIELSHGRAVYCGPVRSAPSRGAAGGSNCGHC